MSAAQEQQTVAASKSDPKDSAPLSSDAKDAAGVETAHPASKGGARRRLFGLGKKKEEEDRAGVTNTAPPSAAISSSMAGSSPTKPLSPSAHHESMLFTSPQRSPRGPSMASPSQRYRSTSPRLHSPASSQIFERNVQDNTLPGELSPGIPAHIQTEDHIPAVLEASSLAITDDQLNPDEVEIVMHSAHQPAAAVVTGGSVHESTMTSPVTQEEFLPHFDMEESASTYGSLDTADPRRLSFISFADVVQAEHAESSRDALHLMSLSLTAANRSPSPVRSPASSHGLSASPPTSGATSLKGMEAVSAKAYKTPGSPTSPITHSPPSGGGELTIETMRQALRRTGSGDLSGARSQPLSAVSLEDSTMNEYAPFP